MFEPRARSAGLVGGCATLAVLLFWPVFGLYVLCSRDTALFRPWRPSPTLEAYASTWVQLRYGTDDGLICRYLNGSVYHCSIPVPDVAFDCDSRGPVCEVCLE